MFRTRAKVVALSLLVLVAGCSGAKQDADAPAVASLQSAPPSSAATAKSERPIVPVDATDDDINAMAQPWLACLVKQGGDRYKSWTAEALHKGVDETDRVIRACLPKMPETLQDHLKRTDLSAFKDNEREFYQCAKREGYKLTDPDPVTGQFGLTSIGPNGDADSPKWKECERQAFAS
jgi:hypothetical protein